MPFGLGFFAAGGAAQASGAFDLLQTTVLGSDTSSVTFNSLGSFSNYRHLQIRAVLKTSDNSVGRPGIRFNGVSSAGSYRAHRLIGDGSSVVSQTDGTTTEIRLDKVTANEAPTESFTPVIWDILDFSSTSKNKTVRSLHGYNNIAAFDYHVQLGSGVFLSTNAITSIVISPFYGTNFKANSRFSLYGLKG